MSLVLTYQKHNACSYSYKLVCVGEKFIKSFKSYCGKEAVTILLAVWSKKGL